MSHGLAIACLVMFAVAALPSAAEAGHPRVVWERNYADDRDGECRTGYNLVAVGTDGASVGADRNGNGYVCLKLTLK